MRPNDPYGRPGAHRQPPNTPAGPPPGYPQRPTAPQGPSPTQPRQAHPGHGFPGQQWQQPPQEHPWNAQEHPSRSARHGGQRRKAAPPGGLRHARPLWKRLHLPYLAVLVVLLPGMLVWPYLAEHDEGRERGLIRPEAQLVSGGTADLVGSGWESVGYLTGFLDGQPAPSEGVELVDVGFRVVPGDEAASTLLQSHCRFRALDEDGRSWEPTAEYSLRSLADDPGTTMSGCTDGEGEPIAPGSEQTLVLTFLVPEEVADDLWFEVTVATSDDVTRPRPEALLFEAEPME